MIELEELKHIEQELGYMELLPLMCFMCGKDAKIIGFLKTGETLVFCSTTCVYNFHDHFPEFERKLTLNKLRKED